MPKVNYAGKIFDSELEVEYYKHLEKLFYSLEVDYFIYHPHQIQNLVGKRSYTLDFLVLYKDRIELVECKGYNPYSKMIDDQIHNVMLSKSSEWLGQYVLDEMRNDPIGTSGRYKEFMGLIMAGRVFYKKIKYLKAYGFVDWDFKNPNTLANKRKEKIIEQKDEIKELRDFKKDAERYFRYHLKIVDNEKLTKPQREWYFKYVEEIRRKYKG